jgi:hypothetical protein
MPRKSFFFGVCAKGEFLRNAGAVSRARFIPPEQLIKQLSNYLVQI